MRIHFLSGYSVQSHGGRVWHSCAFGSWWESLLLDFHSWKKKIISWCPQISWHDVQEEGSEDKLLAGSGPGLESAGPSSSSPGECPAQGASREAPRHTGLQSPGWGRAPLALRQPPPLLTTPTLIWRAWGCRTDGHQLTGKQGKAEDSTKRWPGAFITILGLLGCDWLWRESVKDA